MASLPLSDGWSPKRRAAAIAVVGGVAAALPVLWASHSPLIAAGFTGAGLIAGGAAIAWRVLAPSTTAAEQLVDWGLARQIAEASDGALAVTDRGGRLVCANDAYGALFDGYPTPPGLPLDQASVSALGTAGRTAWRDGRGTIAGLAFGTDTLDIEIARAGDEGDMLVWRAKRSTKAMPGQALAAALTGDFGDRLGAAGVMAALVDGAGRAAAMTRALASRALGGEGNGAGEDMATLIDHDGQGGLRFTREGVGGRPLRLLTVPLEEGDDGAMLLVLRDDQEAPRADTNGIASVGGLVDLLPLGLALVGRDGRFLRINDAFLRAARVEGAALPTYPGDLVVREDKAAIADAVRRFAGGVAPHTADMAIRLKDHPDEPVVLTIAGARGLGDAAVVLSLKDNSEELRLKREVAQATKMQAVGQLAGGVAHDFNNILTAIIGHCDLMLMRHSPGDSDYDDIQQVRTNSNRAASLTRQLLAFSRQQTMRPQMLQLPDVVSEVSTLLKRLLGETVKLVVTHGRGLGAVRADPGQLEQVVVNLAVNARDAMLASQEAKGGPRGGGTLTIQTRSVSAAEVKRMGSDVLPPRRLYRTGRQRYRHRHPGRHPAQDIRALFYHQGCRQGHRPGAVDRLWHRQAIRRLDLRRIAARARRGVYHVPAGSRRRRRECPRAGALVRAQAGRDVGYRHHPAGRG